jgi:hypothetical protein
MRKKSYFRQNFRLPTDKSQVEKNFQALLINFAQFCLITELFILVNRIYNES